MEAAGFSLRAWEVVFLQLVGGQASGAQNIGPSTLYGPAPQGGAGDAGDLTQAWLSHAGTHEL